ncbi:MAG TPA: hypothetical protein VEP66_10665 [Myxococcales bacterium]|nr:hypothetical protein [Myxococcales bacterium]
MRLGLALLVLLAACNTTNPNTAIGEFSSPTGIGATGAGDRDLVFIANSGRDSVRALQLCNRALLLDGGVDPADTCPSAINGQFIPAPVRVFAAAIETGDRPVRVAGVRLGQPDGGASGVALVAGAANSVAMVDGLSLVQSVTNPTAAPRVDQIDAGARTVDVVAANKIDPDLDLEVATPAGVPGVTAFVATETDLQVFSIILDPATGRPIVPTAPIASCTLGSVTPIQLALVPGSDAQVYVADGAGDGVVVIPKPTTIGGACDTTNRISAGGRSVRSLALSPRWYEGDAAGPGPLVTHVPGELLLMVVEPSTTVVPGRELDSGGVLFAWTGLGGGTKGLVPIPPFGLMETNQEPMQPLGLPVPGLLREGAFLRAVKPRASPTPPDLTTCTATPCTPLFVSQPTNAPLHSFLLIAAVTATDGSTAFIELPARRFVNENLYSVPGELGIVPTVDQPPTYSPVTPIIPALNIDTPTFFQSGLTSGLTRKASWRAVWHSTIPGLERRGGTIRPKTTNPGTLVLSLPASLQPWQQDPAVALGVGDVVSLGAYDLTPASTPPCNILLNEAPYRFELPITAIPDPTTVELAELPDTNAVRGFHPDGCNEFGTVAEFRAAGTQPWVIFAGNPPSVTASQVYTVRGRMLPDRTFTVHEQRFDYPHNLYAADCTGATSPCQPLPSAANDVSFTFNITGPEPTAPKSGFTWAIGSGQLPLTYSDQTFLAGFATAVHPYSSPRRQMLIFTSITGNNEVVQADPLLLFSNVLGLQFFR